MPRKLDRKPIKGAPPIDSLGNVRVYFDLPQPVSAGVTMMAARYHLTKRQMLERICREAVEAEQEIAAIVGLV